jgi:hypothetical protein
LLLGFFVVVFGGILAIRGNSQPNSSTTSNRSDLEYLKAINSTDPQQDPQFLFWLMTQYVNANLQADGAEFFSARLKEFAPRLTSVQKSLYLSIIGLLRAHPVWNSREGT